MISDNTIKVYIKINDSCGATMEYSREGSLDYVNDIYNGMEIRFLVDQFRYALLSQGYHPETVNDFIPEVLV